ncbi:MAG: dihydrodipicolinate synthase family protein [Firmicutes bacterium]|nr:dihydrodipicolinate synthase family protein [Bacillota bacterium]
MSYTKIHGVLPPMITPFKENGDVDFEGFASNVKEWNKHKLAGYLVIGSNSETAFLNEDEKLELIKLTCENAAPGRQILVGTGMDSVRETIKLTNKAAKLGADAALILTPHYYSDNMQSANLVRFFTEVADNTDIPVLIYNVSKYTHVNIPADALATLSKHPNIVGMKDSNGNVPQLATFLRVADPSFQVMTGTFSAWYPALCMGITGIISAMANCCPDPIAEVQELYDAGKTAEAFALYQKWFPVNAAVTGKYGIAGLKYAADKNGFTGGFVRNPLLDSTEKDKAELDAILAKAMN